MMAPAAALAPGLMEKSAVRYGGIVLSSSAIALASAVRRSSTLSSGWRGTKSIRRLSFRRAHALGYGGHVSSIQDLKVAMSGALSGGTGAGGIVFPVDPVRRP